MDTSVQTGEALQSGEVILGVFPGRRPTATRHAGYVHPAGTLYAVASLGLEGGEDSLRVKTQDWMLVCSKKASEQGLKSR